MRDIHSAGQYLMPCALTPLLNHVCMLVAPQCTQKQIQLCV
ncbi:hypothetical protein [Butyricicoccus sp. Marseille-Q5471]|nr:hypothetical protein [Butyricicoccus sp. Marseille-Q5471]